MSLLLPRQESLPRARVLKVRQQVHARAGVRQNCGAGLARALAGVTDQKRDVQNFIVERAAFGMQAVRAAVVAVVGGEDDDRVLPEGLVLLEATRRGDAAARVRTEHLAHLVVDAGLHPRIVVQELRPGRSLGPGIASGVVCRSLDYTCQAVDVFLEGLLQARLPVRGEGGIFPVPRAGVVAYAGRQGGIEAVVEVPDRRHVAVGDASALVTVGAVVVIVGPHYRRRRLVSDGRRVGGRK